MEVSAMSEGEDDSYKVRPCVIEYKHDPTTTTTTTATGEQPHETPALYTPPREHEDITLLSPSSGGEGADPNTTTATDVVKADVMHLKGTTNTAKSRIYTIDTIGQADEAEPPGLCSSFEGGDFEYIQQCRCMPKRYVLTILSFFGFFNVYCLRVDLSVALVAMTSNHTKIRLDGTEYRVSPIGSSPLKGMKVLRAQILEQASIWFPSLHSKHIIKFCGEKPT